jgi:hypothetical protein
MVYEFLFFIYEFMYILQCVISLYYPAHVTSYIFVFFVGTNSMSSKETLRKLINQNSSERKAQPPLFTPRKTVSSRATSSDKKCPMKMIIKIIVFIYPNLVVFTIFITPVSNPKLFFMARETWKRVILI